MAIDAHSHLWTRDYIPEQYLEHLAGFLASWRTGRGQPTTAKQLDEEIFPLIWDADGSRTLAQMDEAGIDKMLLLPIDVGLTMGEAERTIEEHNRHLAEIAASHPDRFVAFFSIDPRRPGAMAMFERSVREWGCRGIKLFPPTGFRPDDEPAFALLKRAAEWGLPIIIHTGQEFEPFDPKLGHPEIMTRVLTELPDAPIFASHMGMAFWRDLIKMAQVYPNLLCDVSAFQLVAKNNYAQFCHIFRRVLDGFGSDRVFFATDGPPFDPFVSKREWCQYFRDMLTKAPEGISFTEQEIAAVLHDNGARLLDRIPRQV